MFQNTINEVLQVASSSDSELDISINSDEEEEETEEQIIERRRQQREQLLKVLFIWYKGTIYLYTDYFFFMKCNK